MKKLSICIVQIFICRILFWISNARNTSSIGRYNLSNGHWVSYKLTAPAYDLVIDEIFQLLYWSTENFVMQMDYFGGNTKLYKSLSPNTIGFTMYRETGM